MKEVWNLLDEIQGKIEEVRDILYKLDKSPQKPTVKEILKDHAVFNYIAADEKDFDLRSVDVSKVFDVKTGKRKDGGDDWTKQSVMIKDQTGQERELIAWGDLTTLFEGIREGDRLDIQCCKSVKEYKTKHQYTVGSMTTVEVVEKNGENYKL